MNRILLLEDDVSLIDGLVYSLKKNEFDVEVARTVCEAKQYLSELDRYDLLILDVTLPDGTGFDVCERVRKENQQIPIIFLTASDEEVSIIRGLDSGGDDYITKPFNAPILLARIANVLKRTAKKDAVDAAKDLLQLEHKGVVLNLSAGTIEHAGKREELTKNELKILHFLYQRPGEIVPRVEIIEYLWDNEAFIDDNTLSVNMTRIRGKLLDIGVEDFIETRRGMGYRI